MGAPGAAEARDGDPLGAQGDLLPLGQPTDVAIEGGGITERRTRRNALSPGKGEAGA